MTVNITKVTCETCFAAINQCIILRNTERLICNVGVVITKEDLGVHRITVSLMNKVTGIMKNHGIQNARYQKESQRFFGIANLKHVVIQPGNIPLRPVDGPITETNQLVYRF